MRKLFSPMRLLQITRVDASTQKRQLEGLISSSGGPLRHPKQDIIGQRQNAEEAIGFEQRFAEKLWKHL